jgi:hypothetical protein
MDPLAVPAACASMSEQSWAALQIPARKIATAANIIRMSLCINERYVKVKPSCRNPK